MTPEQERQRDEAWSAFNADLNGHPTARERDAFIFAWSAGTAAERERNMIEIGCLNRLLVCYRTGRRPSESLLNQLAAIREGSKP